MKIFNSLSNKIEPIVPLEDNIVKIYSCGLTVYDYAHIGNLRKYIFDDLLVKSLKFLEYDVRHVINITDVGHLTSDQDVGEDKVEKGAKREGKSAFDIARFYEKAFIDDLKKLNIDLPDFMPRATEHINEQIALIERLENKGYTYKTSDGIYFDTAKFSEYGKLGNLKEQQMKEGVRVERNLEKKNPSDFALWKFSYEGGRNFDSDKDDSEKKRQMEWESPWGVGFPGWHLECSAMSTKYLGQPFDIHTGGIDHIGTHHNNEIAQSEGAYGKPLAKYFVHSEHLLINGRKMAKSEGGYIKLSDIIEKGFSPLDFRYLCLSAHYRSKLDFSWDSLQGAKNSRAGLQEFYNKINSDKQSKEEEIGFYNFALEDFKANIENDLNTPKAFADIFVLFKKANELGYLNSASADFIDKVNTVLSVVEECRVVKEGELLIVGDIGKDIIEKTRERNMLRNKGEYEKADKLRAEIEESGYVLEDTENETRLSKST